jgi:tetratricopeptide (TPR) repeat protein
MRLAQAFAAATSDFERGQQELAYAYNNLGTAEYGRSQLIDALGHFEQAAAIRRGLQRESATDSETLALVDTLSWIGQAQSNLGQPHEAIESLQAGLKLLNGHFSDSRDAGSRRRAIDLRFILAQILLDLDQESAADAKLDGALVLARADAANDPTQPRRRIKLAHIAFRVARIQSKPLDVRMRALSEGTAALESLLDSPLPQHERVHALVEACSAHLSLNPSDTRCSESVLARLVSLTEAEAQRLAHPVTELASRARTNLGLAQLSRELLAQIPEPRRQSLRYKLSEAALIDSNNAASAKAIGLRAEIARLRATPTR